MEFIQEQRPPINNKVGSSVDRLCADFNEEQLGYKDLNSIIAKARLSLTSRKGKSVRVMTYNVHAWADADGRFSTDRIFDSILEIDADVICLNEASGYVDGTKHGGRIDDRTVDLLNLRGMTKLQRRMAVMGYPYSTASGGKK